jgi:hypothetical protein
MNKPLMRQGIALVYQAAMDLDAESMFGKEDERVKTLRDGLARLLSATRHDGIYVKEQY